MVFLGLISFYFIDKDNINIRKDFNKNSSSPTPSVQPSPSVQPLVYSIPSDWKTYTTNKIMNIHPEILQKHPGIELPSLTFRYPSTWHVETLAVSLANMDFQFPLLFQISKIHPKNGSILAVEGLLPDNVGFRIGYGVTPTNFKEFDGEFWRSGHAHTRTESFEVDGRRLTLGYYESDLVSALYHISPNAQLLISVDFANTDRECQTQYCISTNEEIKQILSSFKFSNFTKSELPNRIINESKSCKSDNDCKTSVCTCEAFNKNENVKGCGIVPFCPGKPKCLYNQCLFLQTEADRP